MWRLKLLACFFFLLSSISALCQDINIGEPETLWVRKRQWDIYANIHTNGVGLGFRYDYIKSIKLQHGIDVEYTFYRHFKEQRVALSEGSTIVYGKKNYFGLLRAGYGCTRILNTKHYSGGVEVGYFFLRRSVFRFFRAGIPECLYLYTRRGAYLRGATI